MTAMANADLSPTMEALEQEPSSGKEMVYLETVKVVSSITLVAD